MRLLIPLAIILLNVHPGFFETTTRLTNIQCKIMEPSFAIFVKCELKVIGRGVVAANVRMRYTIFKRPNVTINISLWKKYNGYRPFMYNKTIEFCELMRKINKISFESMFFKIFQDKTNLNHSCPYNEEEDLIIKNLVVKEEYLKFFPLPSGNYKFQIMTSVTNRWQTQVDAYIERKEDLMKS